MQNLKDALASAVAAGILDEQQHLRLESHLAAAGLLPAGTADGPFLDAPRDSEPLRPDEESEAPRFVRGFHDVLITIGIVLLLSGVAAAGGAMLLIPLIVVLAEVLVRRQRLALPAFALTVALLFSVAPIIEGIAPTAASKGLAYTGATALVLAAFYWRYGIPVALAGLITLAISFVFILTASSLAPGDLTAINAFPVTTALAGLVCAVTLFVIAMWFDLKDPMRQKRWSDVAFWLHLSAAPALLYAFMAVLAVMASPYANQSAILEAQPVLAILPVVLLMLTGIVIDRRAFVTSGLITLGLAIGYFVRSSGIEITNTTALAVIALGVIVLMLGTGWQRLRAIVVALLPSDIRAALPPVRT